LRQWLRRVDHAAIFLTIAGTYTAIAGLALPPRSAIPVLVVVWCGGLAGATLQLLRGHAARWLEVGPYLALGWTAVVVVPQLFDRLGVAGFGLLALGAALYILGATVYAGGRPEALTS
jgi:hemolysin III